MPNQISIESRMSLIERQEVVVRGLQGRVADSADSARSGDVKDLAMALAASVDKLVLLHEEQGP